MRRRRVVGAVLAALAVISPNPRDASGQQWIRELVFADQSGRWAIVTRFGVWPGATDGIDDDLREVQIPPPPPGSLPDFRFLVEAPGYGTYLDLREPSTTREHVLLLGIQWPGDAPAVLSWDPKAMAAATRSARLRDPFGVGLLDIDMRAVREVVLEDWRLNRLELAFVSSDVVETSSPTRLQIVEPPEGTVVGSGRPIPPVVVHVTDDEGRLVPRQVRVTMQPLDGLSGTLTVMTEDGVARFEDLVFTATKERQAFTLNVASPVTHGAALGLIADLVIATRLAVVSAPGRVGAGCDWVPRLEVAAVDEAGAVDRDFCGPICVRLVEGAGRLVGDLCRPAVAGVAEFALRYETDVAEDHLAIAAAVDAAAGQWPALTSASQVLEVGVSALRFTQQPNAVVSGQPLAVELEVTALDLDGQVDTAFQDTVVVTVANGSGRLRGATRVVAVAGTARFPALAYVASVDHEAFVLRAASTNGLSRATESAPIDADVVAAQWRLAGYSRHPPILCPVDLSDPVDWVLCCGADEPDAFRLRVHAVDEAGCLDVDHAGEVALRADGPAIVGGQTTTRATGGVAEFALELAYHGPGGSGGAGPQVLWLAVTAADPEGLLTSASESIPLVLDETGTGRDLWSATAVAEAEAGTLPARFALHGARPNPFNASTHLVLDVPSAAAVTVEMFDLTGRCVMRAGPALVPAGARQSLALDGRGLASGVYLVRVSAATGPAHWQATGKVLLLR